MSVQTRTTALQNEVVRLYCLFIQDGVLTNPGGQPTIEILDTNGVTVLDIINPEQENIGLYFADWYIPANLPLGSYYDKWTFQWANDGAVQEQTMIFTVHSLNSYINFISKGVALKRSNRATQLMMDLANDFIFEAQHIPVYSEEVMRMQQDNQEKRSKTYYFFTIPNESATAYEGDRYSHNGQIYTVFEDFSPITYTSSSTDETSSSSSMDSSSSSSMDSSSSDSTESESSESDNSESSSTSQGTSSSTSYEVTTTTTTNYRFQRTLTVVGTGDPTASGDLEILTGDGDDTISFTTFDSKQSTFSTIYNCAYKNWNMDPRPVVRVNNRILDDNWHADYDGKIYFDTLMAPEDQIHVQYSFAYFSEEELMSFLLFGLRMMNSVPPASEQYFSLEIAPTAWDAGILLWAAQTALKRLIFGLNWQEKMVIYGRPEDAQSARAAFEGLYQSYAETWTEFSKNVKTRKLPGLGIYITPEYTLPGGRSRWFRYMFKGGS
tara:strand:+ start:56364 stop:57845 length:1482 start_codon:yes stop_codon:yes gene_type:complete